MYGVRRLGVTEKIRSRSGRDAFTSYAPSISPVWRRGLVISRSMRVSYSYPFFCSICRRLYWYTGILGTMSPHSSSGRGSTVTSGYFLVITSMSSPLSVFRHTSTARSGLLRMNSSAAERL